MKRRRQALPSGHVRLREPSVAYTKRQRAGAASCRPGPLPWRSIRHPGCYQRLLALALLLELDFLDLALFTLTFFFLVPAFFLVVAMSTNLQRTRKTKHFPPHGGGPKD